MRGPGRRELKWEREVSKDGRVRSDARRGWSDSYTEVQVLIIISGSAGGLPLLRAQYPCYVFQISKFPHRELEYDLVKLDKIPL